MNILKEVAKFTRDLLTYNENLIKIGRQNFTREQFEQNYIVVDGLGAAIPTSRIETFDGDTEKQSFGSRISKPITLDFYGDDAYTNAELFRMSLRTQSAYELQKTYGLSVYDVSSITDVKALTGQQYGNRVQVEFMVQYCNTLTIDTLRIDVAQIEIIKDN